MRVGVDKEGNDACQTEQQNRFFQCLESVAAFVRTRRCRQLQPVIHTADGCQRTDTDQPHPHIKTVRSRQLAAQQRGDKNRDDDDQPAHGGGAGLALHDLIDVGASEVGHIANFFEFQKMNDARADGQHDCKSHQQRQHGTELRDRQHVQFEPVVEPEKHVASKE